MHRVFERTPLYWAAAAYATNDVDTGFMAYGCHQHLNRCGGDHYYEITGFHLAPFLGDVPVSACMHPASAETTLLENAVRITTEDVIAIALTGWLLDWRNCYVCSAIATCVLRYGTFIWLGNHTVCKNENCTNGHIAYYIAWTAALMGRGKLGQLLFLANFVRFSIARTITNWNFREWLD
ncbi:uncharacterized protein VTP21DRAFT_9713 [Calcarisporiella thermophila]|uniref:uncharacterized protein n=1 Tax=Calcarisporiella thermophila TaxID=911321 RepID=UPI0037434E76